MKKFKILTVLATAIAIISLASCVTKYDDLDYDNGTVYLRGAAGTTVNGTAIDWDTGVSFTWNSTDSVWEGTVVVSSTSYQFKFFINGSYEQGSDTLDKIEDSTQKELFETVDDGYAGTNLTAKATGTYAFVVDLVNEATSVTKQ